MITENPMTALEKRTVGSLALLYSFRMLGLFMVLPVLALYQDQYQGGSVAIVGLALGIYGLTQASLQIPFGWASDRWGRKPMITLGLVLFIAGSLVAALSQSWLMIVLGRALQGAGAIAAVVLALASDITSNSRRTLAMAMIGASIGLAFIVALVLGPVLGQRWGLQGLFYISAGLAALALVIVWWWVPSAPDFSEQSASRSTGFGEALRDPELLQLSFGVLVLHAVMTAAFLLIPRWLLGHGVPVSEFWQVYLLAVLGSIPLAGLLMRWCERQGVVTAIFLLMLSLVLAQGFAQTWLALIVALGLFFGAFMALEAFLPSRVSRIAPPHAKGGALGVYSTCQFGGAFIGGAGGGALMQGFGAVFVVTTLSALLLLWAVLAWRLRGTSTWATDAA